MRYLLLAFFLFGCGKLPDITITPNPGSSGSGSGSGSGTGSEGGTLRKTPSGVRCQAIYEHAEMFTDVQLADYNVTWNKDGTTDVFCAVTNDKGIKVAESVHFNSDSSADTESTSVYHEADYYFGLCRIWYQKSYVFEFLTPGYFQPEKPRPVASEVGWQVGGIPKIPQNARFYNPSTCEEIYE